MRSILIISLFISYNASAQTVIDHSGSIIEPKILDVLMRTVSEPFRDPYSTQFRNIRPSNNSSSYCGEVNGKNGFGAYVGFMPFLFTPEHRIPAPADDPGPGRVKPVDATILNPGDEENYFALKNMIVSMHGCTDAQGNFIRK